MDLISNILKENGGALASALVSKTDMGKDKAEAFLPEAGSSLMDALTSRASSLDMSDLASQANVSSLMGAMDTAKLASKVGVTAEQGSKGLMTFLPMVLGFLQDSNADDLLGLLGKADGLGDTLGKLKGIGKLFG